MIRNYLAAAHPLPNAKLDVLTARLALGLIQGRQLVNDAVTGSQGIDASGLNINANIHIL